MDSVDPQRRTGVHGRLVDTTLLRALLLGGPGTATALACLERGADGLLAVSAWCVLQLVGAMAKLSQPNSCRPTTQTYWELLKAFLEERAPVAWFTPEDFAMVRQLQRHHPELAPGYPVEVLSVLLPGVALPDFTSSACGAASAKPSWR